MFSLKDRTPDELQSHVVYKFCCAGCNASYIGETNRHLQTRIEEHTLKDKNSAIFKHLRDIPDCTNKYDKSSFSIIDRADTKFKLEIKEAFHIKICSPSLNKQVHAYKMKIMCA